VVMHLVLAMFETKRIIDEPMDVPLWRQCSSYLQRILNVLETSKKVRHTPDCCRGSCSHAFAYALSMAWVGCTLMLLGVVPSTSRTQTLPFLFGDAGAQECG
jgi:hypothetical protein